jgi:hypothetical protein
MLTCYYKHPHSTSLYSSIPNMSMPRPKMPDPTCTLTTDAADLLVEAGGDVEAGEAVLGGTVADGVELLEDELEAEDGTVMFTDDSCGHLSAMSVVQAAVAGPLFWEALVQAANSNSHS